MHMQNARPEPYRPAMPDVPWPYGKNLLAIRGKISMERAANMVGATRGTWNAWEKGHQRPGDDKLKAIVEAFDCPPELIGYEPPKGWALVPTAWIVQRFDALDEKLDRIQKTAERANR
jgi:transcriptional regulator with XRE-family HTH domain